MLIFTQLQTTSCLMRPQSDSKSQDPERRGILQSIERNQTSRFLVCDLEI